MFNDSPWSWRRTAWSSHEGPPGPRGPTPRWTAWRWPGGPPAPSGRVSTYRHNSWGSCLVFCITRFTHGKWQQIRVHTHTHGPHLVYLIVDTDDNKAVSRLFTHQMRVVRQIPLTVVPPPHQTWYTQTHTGRNAGGILEVQTDLVLSWKCWYIVLAISLPGRCVSLSHVRTVWLFISLFVYDNMEDNKIRIIKISVISVKQWNN